MRHEINVVFDDASGKLEVETGEMEAVQAGSILLAAAKKLRQAEGFLQVVVTKNVKTQEVSLEFQSDEVLTWNQVIEMLGTGVRQAEFREWFSQFMVAQQHLAQQAGAGLQQQLLAAQGAGRPRGKLHL